MPICTSKKIRINDTSKIMSPNLSGETSYPDIEIILDNWFNIEKLEEQDSSHVLGSYSDTDPKTDSTDGGWFLAAFENGNWKILGAYAWMDISCSEVGVVFCPIPHELNATAIKMDNGRSIFEFLIKI